MKVCFMEKQAKVVVFTSSSCVWCKRAKDYFQQKKIRFKEMNVSTSASAAAELQRMTGALSVPVILINNRPVIGFDVQKINRMLGIH